MAFREIYERLDLPDGASLKFRVLTALERMLNGTLYEDLPYSFETESAPGRKYVSLRDRRPSLDFNLCHEMTQDTFSELFGDEQFPIVKCMVNKEQSDNGTSELLNLLEASGIDERMEEIYTAGVVGAVAVVVYRSPDGSPYYDILPAKWIEPVYKSLHSTELVGLTVTYPINKKQAEEICPGITNEPDNRGQEIYWYRYIVGPYDILDFRPLSDKDFARIGEKDLHGDIIQFVDLHREDHGFKGRTPVVYCKNLGGTQRETVGPALWWPVRNMIVGLDYGLSEVERGLRFSADPMLFLKKTGLAAFADSGAPAGYEAMNAVAEASAARDEHGAPVRGVTQTIVGEDAKFLEISANGIKEKREFAKDLREYILEVLGGMKARAEHLKGAPSGKSLDKGLKPLRRVVRRQRRPYGRGLLLDLIDLTLYGLRANAITLDDVNVAAIPEKSRNTLEWPNDETLQGAELLAHVQGMQFAAGGSLMNPKELIAPDPVGARLAADMGFNEPYDTIKGSSEPLTDPEQPVKLAAMKPPPTLAKASK